MFFICHILIFYLFHFSTIWINISIHFNQQRYILLDSGHFQYRMDWNL